MRPVFFVSDLHGNPEKYEKLFDLISKEKPELLLLGGDLFPSGVILNKPFQQGKEDFLRDYLAEKLLILQKELGDNYPLILLILGNDDPRSEEKELISLEEKGIWRYIHKQKIHYQGYNFFGYANVPPSPFLLKDWERFDVSGYIDPGSISPLEGYRTVLKKSDDIEYYTIARELEILSGDSDLFNAVFLFHAPPYNTNLDRAGLDGKMIDHVPLDLHVGSIAIRRLIEERHPLITLHGHIHESARISGSWRDKIGNTYLFGAAHDGPELALVLLDLENPENTTRKLI
ncbi:MAG: metallophosphoesterase [Candidatus Cloacimonetes bacterium]|nr:metallophosphoesterase [Candidatus Cloacimonadota bacterium]